MRRFLIAVVLIARTAVAEEAVSAVNWRKVAIAPTVVGAVGLLTGVSLVVASRVSPQQSAGMPALETAGWIAAGVGLGLIAVGALTCALSDKLKVAFAVAPLLGGGALSVSFYGFED